MLESMTIFTKGGLILYQYTPDKSLFGDDLHPVTVTRDALNTVLIQKILLDPAQSTKTIHIEDRLSLAWIVDNNDNETIYAAIHPDILFQGPRLYLQQWVQQLLERTQQEYTLFRKAAQQDRPDPKLFDPTFQVLLSQSKGETGSTSTPTTESTPATAAELESSLSKDEPNKRGKEKRNWRDDTAKVTSKAMAELDKSKANDGSAEDAHQRALQEARAAYLPEDSELESELVGEDLAVEESTDQISSGWMSGLLQHLTGNKVLTSADLEAPLQEMEQQLVSKNVNQDIARDLCQAVEKKLVGKRLNSLYRVQTAVQQAFESTLTQLLKNDVELLHAIATKRGDKSLFTSSRNQAPYVIAVIGINGVGKSTSLAKLAYYLKENGCSPLLVAGDTFRSGAVEQLRVHADCLEVPLFSQGYSKDPSAVAKAAIAHATENKHDVVLIDTAGRMQNNVPLMKALGKLVSENQPDFCCFVCEALVGHDGLNQFQMFQQALGRQNKINGLILTKFDTVSDKVGAALTLTHETGVPILFCGTGQKYHHLKKLNAPAVVQCLLK